MTSPTGSEGYSLIEVLVATVVLFAGLTAVLGTFNAAVSALDAASETLASTEVLKARMAELDLHRQGTSMETLASSGTSAWLGEDYRWQLEATQCAGYGGTVEKKVVVHACRARGGVSHALAYGWVQFPREAP